MPVNVADQHLIQSIFFLNNPNSSPTEVKSHFQWEGKPTEKGWTRYLYIENSTSSVHWIFPEYASFPAFISLQNSPYPLSAFRKSYYKWMFSLNLQERVADGAFYVREEEQLPLHELMGSVPHESFAILTNTTGKYRKSVVALNQGKYSTHFIKLAHTPKSTELVYNEVYALQILAQRRHRKVVHPFLSHTSGDHAVIISSVKPRAGNFSRELGKTHFQAVQDLYRNFSHSRILKDLPYYSNLHEYKQQVLDFLEKGASGSKNTLVSSVKKLWHSYESLSENISPEKELWVSLTHGDFLPWNMYVTPRQVYLYDWENMQESLPLLYDLFYFIFHSSQTYSPERPESAVMAVLRMKESPNIQEILEQFGISFDTYLQLYLLVDIPFLLQKYLRYGVESSQTELELIIQYWQYILSEFIGQPV